MISRFSFNFLYRLLYGSLFVLIGTIALFSSTSSSFSWFFVLACFAAQLYALKEFYAILSNAFEIDLKSLSVYILSGFLYALHSYMASSAIQPSSLPIFFLIAALFTLSLQHFKKVEGSLLSIAASLFGALYVTIPLLFAIDLGLSQDSLFKGSSETIESMPAPFWLVATIISSKGSDIAAYCIGKMYGKTALAPHLSPKKTIEGAVAGLIGAIIGFWTTLLIFCPPAVTPYSCAIYTILALCIGAISQISDLIESLFKRDGKVKDSSTSIPGLGGVLDVVDSLIFTFPFVYYVIAIFKNSL